LLVDGGDCMFSLSPALVGREWANFRRLTNARRFCDNLRQRRACDLADGGKNKRTPDTR
jgi:hypothetical protein